MRDSTHLDFINRWIVYIEKNLNWRDIHDSFINSQFENAYDFINKLSKTKEGQLKIVDIYGIKNIKGYPKLLDKLQD